MKKLTKMSAGFTLVELMVVVAIIGILSAIAVPNFKKYQAKSKQSEAKIQLAALYNTEVAAQADYDTFASCIGDLGYETPPKGYYIVGFTAAAAAGNSIVTSRSGTCASTFAVSPTKQLTASTSFPTAVNGTTTATQTAFIAAATGNISGGGSAAYDSWTITEAKSMSNITVGY